MIQQAINLNLIPGQVLPRLNISQYDKGSRTLVFNIYNGSVLYSIPEDATVNIQGTKPDYTSFQYSCMHSGSVATVNLQEQMATVAGEVDCELTISQAVEGVVTLLGTCNFIIYVEASAVSDDTIISETDLPLIQQALQAATEAQASATSAAASAAEAEEWSANPPYIGANGNWFVYDIENETFVDSGMPSRGEQGETGATPDISMTAAVDTSVGTPSIVITKTGTSTNPFFHLDFSGLKGETGITPDISMTASVDTSVGTPSIVISETGTDENPNFDFAFSGLKGETGATGPQGETGDTGATGNGILSIAKTSTSGLVDTYTITFTNGTTTTFEVRNGADGQGAGDMTKAVYDALNAVADAGGIPAYVDLHVDKTINSQAGVHGLRFWDDKLEYYDSDTSTWVEIQTGGSGTTIVNIPTVTETTYTYDGTEQTFAFDSIESAYITVTNNQQTNAGTYTVTCSLKSASYVWSDLTTEDKTFSWTINKATVAIPVADSVSYTYDGTQQTFAFSSIDSTNVTVSGDKQTNAGSYTVSCALNDTTNNEWTDTTTTAKEYAWTIAKAASSISVSPASITLDADNLTVTLVPTTTGDGAVSYSGYDSSIITIAGNVVTATQTGGSTTITATISATTNYNAASTTVSVSASFGPTLVSWSSGTDAQITAMVEGYYNGDISLADIQGVWSVGDVRSVSLSAMSATGVGESHRAQTIQLQILGFDHDTLTTAQGGKTKALITVDQKNCLMTAECEAGTAYSGANTEAGYMNSTGSNSGGWESSARKTWCEDVYFNALPSYLQDEIKAVDKLTSNGTSVAAVSNTVFLLSEIEVIGSNTNSLADEGTQYQLYADSSSNIYKLPLQTSNLPTGPFWERSPAKSNATSFCFINAEGSAYPKTASEALGIAPAFCL